MKEHIRTHHGQPANESGLDRRGFVALGSAAFMAQALAGAHNLAFAENVVARAQPMTIGYLRGSQALLGNEEILRRLEAPDDGLADLVREAWSSFEPMEIIPAEHLPAGDEKLMGGVVRMRVHGLLPPPEVATDVHLESAILEVGFRIPGHGVVDFTAWAFDRYPIQRVGRPTSFTVPIRAGEPLRLSLLTRTGVPGPETTEAARSTLKTVATLGAGIGSSQPKLRTGLYFLGLDPSARAALPIPATYDYLVSDEQPFLVISISPATERPEAADPIGSE